MSEQEEKEPLYPGAISSGAGVVAGGVSTSGVALTAAGGSAAGVTGYVAGVAALTAHVACEAAAVVGLSTVLAGPVLGGLMGYGIYRGVKKIAKR